MGAAYFIVTEREVPDSFVNGKALARVGLEALDERCQQLGVRALSGFISQDPEETAGFLEAEGRDPSTLDLPAEQWFEPAEGLAVVRALLAQSGELPEDPEAVAEDLREYEALLSRLERERVRWHLGVDF